MLFILPPLAGMVIGAALCLSHRLKFLTSYAVCIPLFGTFGGWIGMNTGASSSLAKLHVWNLTDLMAVSTLFLVGTCGRIWDRCEHWRVSGIMYEPIGSRTVRKLLDDKSPWGFCALWPDYINDSL